MTERCMSGPASQVIAFLVDCLLKMCILLENDVSVCTQLNCRAIINVSGIFDILMMAKCLSCILVKRVH